MTAKKVQYLDMAGSDKEAVQPSMTAKKYLEQAYTLDHRINSRLEQLSSLKALATRTTGILRQDAVKTTPDAGAHSREEIIAKIIDMEKEIDAEIDRLVDLKREIYQVIGQVENPVYQTLLELRYLSFRTWDEIGAEMNYTRSTLMKYHKQALKEVEKLPRLC